MKLLSIGSAFIILLFVFSGCTTTKKEWGSKKEKINYEHTFVESGYASFYGKGFAGKPTASGKIYDPGLLTAASKTLPLHSRVLVKDVKTGRFVVVTINDKGPFIPGRVIDLSVAAAKKLGIMRKGVAKVEVFLVKN
ncbi:septal ring lytic transglycosylase RlpA family protein [Fluviispira multicolorata]|uniref:Probable endolytic peptidoglycan transglycosylase RlpA n=1 Tax=Fluviispira multicolorata TaxID=2654512 RepID=A0A833JAC8_9BACT|nr:septal ring lytic transglycosylase RlpA family protein [Fluviispira multicolorata]KAB8027761.1 septal ring lytic transglycosylase RlpA family protein [Fluviispira multicolorata]